MGVYSVSKYKNNIGTIKFDTSISKEQLSDKIAEILKMEIGDGVSEEEICIVAPQWYQIYPMASKLRKLLWKTL